MRYFIYCIIFINLGLLKLIAQQDAQFSHYMFNTVAKNPGCAGSLEKASATVLIRNQWTGMVGAPTTRLASIHTPKRIFGTQSGLGFTLLQDKIGFNTNTTIKLAYAYHTSFHKGTLGIGFDLGLYNRNLEAKWEWPEGPEPGIPSEDQQFKFGAGLGVFYRTGKYYIGLSTDHVYKPKLTYEQEKASEGTSVSGTSTGAGAGTFTSFIGRHYFLTAGYTLLTPIALLEVTPSIYVKAAGLPKSENESFNTKAGLTAQYDYSVVATYNKKFWGGLSYRLQDAIVVLAGLELINGLRVGFSYDFTTTKIRKVSNSTFEIYLNYNFDIGWDKTPTRYKSVRYL